MGQLVGPRPLGVGRRFGERLYGTSLGGVAERSNALVLKHAGLQYDVLDRRAEAEPGLVALGTMPIAMGLEFGAVAVMDCNDEVLPLQSGIEAVGDEADLQADTTWTVTCSTSRAGGPGPAAGGRQGAGLGVPGRSLEVRTPSIAAGA